MADQDYVFIVEWFDTSASLVRTYNFTYHTKDNTIEMYDLKNKRVFLKRCEYAGIQLKDIFIGAILNVYSRQLKVTEYADAFTRNKFEKQRGKAFALVKPEAYLSIGKVVNLLEENGFTIGNIKMAKFTKRDAENFFNQSRGKQGFQENVEAVSSDLTVAIEAIADDCISKMNQIIGSSQFRNSVYTSETSSRAAKDIEFVFSQKSTLGCPAMFNNCSCCVIKPHTVTEGYCGQILDTILNAGFEVSAMQMFWLDRPSAEEFLEVYKGVVPEYNQMVEELTNGPCIALQVRQENAVKSFREVCGPHDPEMAKTVRPKSLRSVYGQDKGRNAVHCTDLPEDAILEVEYFFNILQNK